MTNVSRVIKSFWKPLSSSRAGDTKTTPSCRSLVKRVDVGLSVQPVEDETVEEIMVQGGSVSPIVTIEPRRRKFHKAITISMPLPERMSAQYLRRRQEIQSRGQKQQPQQSKTPIGKLFFFYFSFSFRQFFFSNYMRLLFVKKCYCF